MLQRKQSVLILIVGIASVIMNVVLPVESIFSNKEKMMSFFSEKSLLLSTFPILVWIVAVLAFIALFLFKNRSLQILLGKVNMLINLYLVGLVAYWSLSVSGGVYTPEKGIWMFILLLNLCLLAISNKWIKKDDNLVKSVDRIR